VAVPEAHKGGITAARFSSTEGILTGLGTV